MIGFDLLGAEGGFGEAIPQVLESIDVLRHGQKKTPEEKAAADVEEKTRAAIAADQAARAALGHALLEQQIAKLDPKRVSAAKAARAEAERAIRASGAVDVPEAGRARRVEAARQAVSVAETKAKAAQGMDRKLAQVALLAAQRVLDRVQRPASAKVTDGAAPSGPGGSFWGRAIVGPLKIWHALTIGAATVGGAILLTIARRRS